MANIKLNTNSTTGANTVHEAPETPSTGDSPINTNDSGHSIQGGLQPTAPEVETSQVTPTQDPTGAARLKQIADADKASGEKIVKIINNPSSVSSTEVKYSHIGVKLNPGESLYLAVPAGLQKGELNFMTLGHEAKKSEDSDTTPDDEWDDNPALASVQVHATNVPASDAWRYWGGPSSGEQGAKFAEFRFEEENLYEWKSKGSVGVESGSKKNIGLNVDAIRVRSLGQDPVHIGMVTLKIAPPEASKLDEAIFTPGASLGAPGTNAGAKYSFSHTYPGALCLGGFGGGPGKAKLPDGWKLNGSNLEISLKAGEKLSYVEAACGDVHQEKQSDGSFKPQHKSNGEVQRGWSKMAMYLKKANGGKETLMANQNVPSKGILTGAPDNPDYVIQPGDKVVISASSDDAWIMAARVGTRPAD